MKRCKKILSLFMAMMMVATFLPFSAFAEEAAVTKRIHIEYSFEDKETVHGIGVDVDATQETVDRNFVESKLDIVDKADYTADKDSYPIENGVVKVHMKKIRKLEEVVLKFSDDGSRDIAAGYSLTAQSNVNSIPGSVYAGCEKEGYALTGWQCGNINFNAGSTVTFEEMAKAVGDNFTSDNKAYLTFAPIWTAKLNTVEVKFVQDIAGVQKEVAGAITVNSASDNFMNGSVYPEFEVKGSVLKGWKVNNVFFAAGQKVKLADFAAIVGTNFDAEGKAVLSAYPVWETKAVINEITIKFVENKDGVQKEVAGSFVLNAKNAENSMYDSVYKEFEVKGYHLAGWKFGDNFFKAGQKVTFAEMSKIVGKNFDKYGKAVLAFIPVFEKDAVAQLRSITIKYLEDKVGPQAEVAAGNTIARDDFTFMAGSVYKEFERQGYKLSGWKCGDRFFKAGQKVDFAVLAEIVGDNFIDGSDAVLAFVPVFDKVNNPDVPQGGGSSQKPSTPADKQPTGRPNVNTGVALF